MDIKLIFLFMRLFLIICYEVIQMILFNFRESLENLANKFLFAIRILGVPSPATIHGAQMTDDDDGIILKWHLESYSPISEYKVNLRCILKICILLLKLLK